MPTLQAAINANKATAGAAVFKRATDSMGREAVQTSGQLKGLGARIDSTAARAKRAKGSMMGMMGGMTAVLALGMTIKTMASYEETMATVGAVTRASEEDFTRLGDTAKELGATTRFSAAEAGDGLLFLARAGFDTDQAITALPSTLSLASAGSLELGEAADFASNILSQFGMEAERTDEVVDSLIITSNRANTDVRQLAEAMKYAGPVAGALGISVQETASMIGALGDAGIQGSLAGTGLRMNLLRLINPTSDAQRVLKGLKLTLDEVNPAKVGGIQAFEALAGALDNLEDSTDKAGLMAKIFGARTAGAALILSDSTEKVRELIGANEEFRGEADEVAKAMDDTLAGSFRALKSAVQGAMIATGDAGFLGVLRIVIDTITGAIRILIGMEEHVTENRVACELLAEVIKFLGIMFGALIAVKIIGFFTNLTLMILNSTIATIKFLPTLMPVAVALAAIGAAVMAWEFGTHLYNEFRFIQEFFADFIYTWCLGWAEIEFAALVVFAALTMGWDKVWDKMVVSFAWAIGKLADGFGQLESFLDSVGIKVDYLGTAELNEWAESLVKAGAAAKTFSTDSFKSLHSFLGSEAAAGAGGVDDNLMRNMLLNFEGGRSSQMYNLPLLEAMVSEFAVKLEAEGTASAKFVADRIREEFNAGLQGIGDIPFTMKVEMLRSMRDEALATAEAVKAATYGEMSGEFGEDRRKHPGKFLTTGLQDQMAEDIGALQDFIMGLLPGFDDLAEKAKAAEDAVKKLLDPEIDQAALDKMLADMADEIEPVTEEATRAAESFAKMFERIDEERVSLKQTTSEHQKYIMVLEAERLAKEAGTLVSNKQLEMMKAEIDALFELKEAQERAQELDQAFQDMGRTISQTFEDLIFDAGQGKLAIEDLLESLAKMAFQQAVTIPMGNALGSIMGSVFGGISGSAMGNLISGGHIVPFGAGGITQGPELFPMAYGTAGLRGEQGPEWIIPVARGLNGELGIKAEGAGTKVVNVVYNITTPDVGGFKRSQRQLTQRARRELS